MYANRILKTHCPKTGQYFKIIIVKDGALFYATDIVPLTLEEAGKVKSEVSPAMLQTASNLPECAICGSRRVGHGHDKSHAHLSNLPSNDKKRIYSELVFDPIGSTQVITTQKVAPKKFNRRIRVSRAGYDDVGAVLDILKVKWEPFNNNYDCDILFLNCLTKDRINYHDLRDFVLKGGYVYGSCTMAFSFSKAFPEHFTFDNKGSFHTGSVPARIVDPELSKALGHEVTLQYNIAGKEVPTGRNLTKLVVGTSGHYRGDTLAAMARVGKGIAYFTTYHNSPKLSPEGRKILEILIVKQLAETEGVSLEHMANMLSYKIK